VDESRVDYAVGSFRSLAQTVEIMEITAVDLCACCGNRLGPCGVASQPKHAMSAVDQLLDNCATDKTCCTCNENTHMKNSVSSIFS